MMNMKSSRRNNKSNSFVIVLDSLQNLWKSFLHMLIEAERSLKRRCEKNTKIRTSSRWSTSAPFWRNSRTKSERTIRCLNIYIQCSWYLQRLSNSYLTKLIRKHNFNLSDSNIIIFELVYKIVIAIIDINDVLRELNVLNLKKNKDSIDKLIDLIKTDQKTNKPFSSETTFAFSVLSAISTQITFKKIIEIFIEVFKIMHFNNVRAVIVDEMQRIINVTLYRQSIALSVNVSIDFEQISIQIV